MREIKEREGKTCEIKDEGNIFVIDYILPNQHNSKKKRKIYHLYQTIIMIIIAVMIDVYIFAIPDNVYLTSFGNSSGKRVKQMLQWKCDFPTF